MFEIATQIMRIDHMRLGDFPAMFDCRRVNKGWFFRQVAGASSHRWERLDIARSTSAVRFGHTHPAAEGR